MQLKKTILIVIILYTFININKAFAQSTKPILRVNTTMHTASVNKVSVDGNGSIFLTVSDDKTAKLWDIKSGELLRTFRVPITEVGSEGQLYAGALNFDGTLVAVAGYTGYEWDKLNSVYIFNAENGNMIERLSGLPNVINDIKFSHNGLYLGVALAQDNGIRIYKNENSSFILFKNYTNYSNETYNLAFSHQGKLATVSADGYIRLYNDSINFISKAYLGNNPFSITFSPDGEKIAVGYKNQNIAPEVLDANTLGPLFRVMGGTGGSEFSIPVVSFSDDGKYLYGAGNYEQDINDSWWTLIRQWNSIDGTETGNYPAAQSSIMDIKTIPQNQILFVGSNPDIGIIDYLGNKSFYKTGEILNFTAKDRSHFKTNTSGSIVEYTAYAKETQVFSLEARRIEKNKETEPLHSFTDKSDVLIAENWKNTYSPSINEQTLLLQPNELSRSIDVKNDTVVLGTTWNIYCFNGKGEKLWQQQITSAAWVTKISPNGKIVIVGHGDGIIRWYNIADGKLLMSLYIHPENNKWVLWTPEGYFDTSGEVEEYIGWHVNQASHKEAMFYNASQFYEKFYTPNLGMRLLNNENIQGNNDVNINNFQLPPIVKITSPSSDTRGFQRKTFESETKEIQIVIEATDQGGGIDEIVLYQNEKLISSTARGFKANNTQETSQKKIFNATLINGINHFKASAFSTQRTEAQPFEITVNYKGTVANTDLYILAIGINQYKNPKWNLKYPVADATATVETIKNNAKEIFGKTEITILTDEESTKENIKKKLKKIQEKITEKDLFLFYYAGHGIMSEEEKAQFFLVMHDVTSPYKLEMLQELGVSALDLQNYAFEIKAQKQVWILDACQSGGAVADLLASRGTAEEKAIAQLARSTGIAVLAASSSDQEAQEFATLGHGLFTHCLLKALEGHADGSPKDGKVTIKEIGAFLDDQVPELSQKFKGQAQYPSTQPAKQDFPIGTVKIK